MPGVAEGLVIAGFFLAILTGLSMTSSA